MGSSKRNRSFGRRVRSEIGDKFGNKQRFHYSDLRVLFPGVNLGQLREVLAREVKLGNVVSLGDDWFRHVREEPVFDDIRQGTPSQVISEVEASHPEVSGEETSHEEVHVDNAPKKLSGFSGDSMRRAQLLQAVREEISAVTQKDPKAEPRVTVAELIPRLQGLKEDPWPQMDPLSEGANYGRCVMSMVNSMEELTPVRVDRPRSPWRIGLAVEAVGEGSDMVLPVSSEDLPRDESGVSPEGNDGIDRTFDTPTPVAMPELTDALVTDLRVQCGAGSFDFARVYAALHNWDEDAFARTLGGRERALKMFAALLKMGIIRKSSFDAMYSFVPVESDETTRLREEVTLLRDKTASLEEQLEALQAELDAVRGEHDEAVQRADQLSARLLDTLNKLGDTQCVLQQERLDHQTTKDSLELMTASRDEAIQRAEYEERDDVLPDGDANPALLAHLHRLRSLNDHLQARLNHLLECDGDMDPFYNSPVLNKPAERVASGDNGLVQLLQSQLAAAQQQNVELMNHMTALAQQAIASSGNVAQTVGEAVASAMEQLLSRVNVRQGEQK
ncbi:MAG: hypothetical protein UV82_C0003G0089 [Candidatus Magasanikbacteria bacterium GW2011_GWD2_43_18]|nr:MAG: hypothetical protein UV18_C0006G0072 [Candidatus Magasanikbacteria bacterium GW2011_GWC2_42_27]KKT04989.1 MAG: hypothetical protein UV82_C0003G0089 [Candidatus Magasanikbacteria bacterium GW2011_GWD2_43_18]HBB38301.1 hypothetical protein [Candidatus Magasanikbacteria bacterium]HCC13615.1 hypothetical protein [Candidatus Magasanikbacteria bacterium]